MELKDINWKRVAQAAGFIIVFILLCIAVYFVFFRTVVAPPPSETIIDNSSTPLPGPVGDYVKNPANFEQAGFPVNQVPTKKTAAEPGEGPTAVQEVESGDNRSPQMTADGKSLVTYDSTDGNFYRITPDGNAEKMSDQTFKGAYQIAWDASANKAAISFYDDTNIVYDFVHNKQVTLPKHWKDVQFEPSGDKIVFKNMADDVDNRWLAIADADGSNGKLIEHIKDKGEYFMPTWSPSDQIIGLYREGYDADRQKLYFIGLNGESFNSAMAPGRGLETAWSPKGTQLLMSSWSASSDYKPELWVMDALGDSIGENRRRLDIQTWAHKCAYADDETLYCGIPTHLDPGAGLIPSKGEDVPDEIYKIDLASGARQKVVDLPEEHTIGKMMISGDQSTLFFQERFNGKLFKIDLK